MIDTTGAVIMTAFIGAWIAFAVVLIVIASVDRSWERQLIERGYATYQEDEFVFIEDINND